MPLIIPHNSKLDPQSACLVSGVVKELEPHHRRLREDEERLRDELKAKEERLRKSLRVYERLEREAQTHALRSELTQKSLDELGGGRAGGVAF